MEEQALQIVTFMVGNEQFGIHIMKVQEIIRVIGAVRVPKSPAYVGGVINLRGKIVPVIDLRNRMGKNITEYTDTSRIIVVDSGSRLAGLVVDAVIDVINLSSDEIEPCPAIDDKCSSKYIKGIGKKDERLITLLNLEDLLIVSQ
ncbi:MAG: purine-binding chemotaxis protein CheW [Nitrospirae bacterium]|nr:purine-binding chemotaxis protein CheW [Nitrospirota bacterium]